MVREESRDQVFVGLGNPGTEYALTRHNMGAILVEALARAFNLTFKEEKRLLVRVAKGVVGETTVHLLLPTTYMNHSGRAIRKYLDYFKIGKEALIVVSDDIALPFGALRVRTEGSAGGHNGLKDIEKCINSSVYTRLRVGIGTPELQSLESYVLEKFSRSETEQLSDVIVAGVNVLKRLMQHSSESVMNEINVKNQKVLNSNTLKKSET